MPYFINIVLNISNKDVKYQTVLFLNDLNPDSLMNFLGYIVQKNLYFQNTGDFIRE